MLALLLMLQSPTADVVVTGKRLEEAQAECARGGCTPLRDAQATIALAETQFRDGKYQDAKRLLAAAVSRNSDKAASAPRPVAALYEAYATVALHEGDQSTYRRAVASQVETLRNNLPPNDPAVISAATALGDMWLDLGNFQQADAAYRSVEKEALGSGESYAAMLVGMKRVWLASVSGKNREADSLLAELGNRPIAREPGYTTALRVLRLRIASRNADEAEISRIVAEFSQHRSAQPILISAPPYRLDAVAQANAHNRKFEQSDLIQTRSSDYSGIRWADIGFWIRPDGHTAEAEILRSSPSPGWAAPALEQIAGRRYAAIAPVGGAAQGQGADQGIYRVERVTKRSRSTVPIGSLISRRVEVGGFEVLDLSEMPADPPTG